MMFLEKAWEGIGSKLGGGISSWEVDCGSHR